MTRNVWPRDQVAHLWANRSQDSARDPHGNFYFTGRALYSYGSHFIIAAHVDLGADGRAVLWNDATYSSTTSKHQWIARRALPSYLTRYGVDGLRDDDMRGRDWMLGIARACVKEAGQRYASAAECVRASAKRNTYASNADRYMVTARALAACVARGDGDAAHVDASAKREARTILRALDAVAALGEYPDDKTKQRQFSADAAGILNRDGMRRTLAERATSAEAAAKNARYNDECGNLENAERYAINAQELAKQARDMAKQFKFRAPKLPDMSAFLADLAPRLVTYKRDILRHAARASLQTAERFTHRARPDARYGAHRYAGEVLQRAAEADKHACADAVPQWMRERAAAIVAKHDRETAITDGVCNLSRVMQGIESARSYVAAGHARDAVRDFARVRANLGHALDAVPTRHPAWRQHVDGIASQADARDLLAEVARAENAARESFAAEDAAALAAWRAGESSALRNAYDDGPRLRVSRDGKAIQTSWGAVVPSAVAPILWRLVQRARKSGEPIDFLPYDETRPRVGSFRLDSVGSDGCIVVGCHRIAWPELEHIAQRMGYIGEGATA